VAEVATKETGGQRTKIKICGLTRAEDVAVAARLGADYLGFILAPSPRRVTPERVAGITAGVAGKSQKVGVFVDAPLEEVIKAVEIAGLDLVQLHGSEDEDYAGRLSAAGIRFIKVFRLGRDRRPPVTAFPGAEALLFDTFLPGIAGGAGKSFDWKLVSGWSGAPFFLAGGLNPENVAEALALTRPYGVDVSSGVEAAPGIKDHARIKAFITAVRAGDGLES
jgi:phosphoribosylanthranilate isomerase